VRVLLSPTEGALFEGFKGDAFTSSIPEQKGADVLLYTKRGLLGIQRKEVPHDFCSSFIDGRLTRETSLLADQCTFKIVVCEGRFRYYPDGSVVISKKFPAKFTREQIRAILFDIKYVKGVDVDYTEDTDDTIRYIKKIAKYFEQDKHLALYTRPAAKGVWYVPSSKDLDLWLLQSFPGIGPTLADSIITTCGGRVPLAWTCTLEQLQKTPRLGKRAKDLWNRLPHTSSGSIFDKLREKIKGD